VNKTPTRKRVNYLFRNKGESLSFSDESKNWGINQPSFSNGAAYADLDNDGDLDLVVNNIDAPAFVFKNTTMENQLGNYLRVELDGKTSEAFAKVSMVNDGKVVQVIENKRVRGYLSATDNAAHFGLGDVTQVDRIRVEWLSGYVDEKLNVKANSTIVFKESEAEMMVAKGPENSRIKSMGNLGINFQHKENDFNDFTKEILLPYKQSTLGPCITKGDVNNDGKEDLFIGGASGQAGMIYIQNDSGFKAMANTALDKDRNKEDLEAHFFDFDGDNDQDLFVVSGGNAFQENSDTYSDRLYLNDGNGNFIKHQSLALEGEKHSGKTVVSLDYDQDGDLDLIVGNRIIPQQYPKHAASVIYENDNGKLKNVTASIAPELSKVGIVNKVIATDFNNDGWQDFIAVGEWTNITFFKNQNGEFVDVTKETGLENEKGWWFTIAETDINKDGLKDYVVGNVGYNIKFKATHDKPFKVYANDFDNSGTLDIVLSNDYNGQYVPVRGKECSTQQMPFISEKFDKYEDFANASLNDIYGDKLQSSYNREVTTFGSVVLINNGDGKFSKSYLPKSVQSFPMLDYDIVDFNNDGFEDLLVIGNIYNTEVETPRLDGGYGMVLLSNQKDNYTILNTSESGLFVDGNAKSIKVIQHQGLNKEIIISGVNDGKAVLLEISGE
ncbi:MAG: VCBS repeat-containing protein, partial [Flavobacteriaceae bacterium]|nr:VCBS repeat-containing protein [Flavobacteriaceae bacterium]